MLKWICLYNLIIVHAYERKYLILILQMQKNSFDQDSVGKIQSLFSALCSLDCTVY